jgi:hypothetical protein
LVPGGGAHPLAREGWESPNSDEGTYTPAAAVLFIYIYIYIYIYMYFVIDAHPRGGADTFLLYVVRRFVMYTASALESWANLLKET